METIEKRRKLRRFLIISPLLYYSVIFFVVSGNTKTLNKYYSTVIYTTVIYISVAEDKDKNIYNTGTERYIHTCMRCCVSSATATVLLEKLY